jgi:hypothetical protein
MSDTHSEVVSSIDQLLPKRWVLVSPCNDDHRKDRYVSIDSVISGEDDKLLTDDPESAYTWLSREKALEHNQQIMATDWLEATELPHSICYMSRVLRNANARYKKAMEAAEIARREAVLIEGARRAELDRLIEDGKIRRVRAGELIQRDVIMDFGDDGGVKERVITKTELIVRVTFADGTSEQYDCRSAERFYVQQR